MLKQGHFHEQNYEVMKCVQVYIGLFSADFRGSWTGFHNMWERVHIRAGITRSDTEWPHNWKCMGRRL